MRWFRLYIELIDDPKMSKLSDAAFRHMILLFCLAAERKKDGIIDLTFEEICWRLRLKKENLQSTLAELLALNIVTKTKKCLKITNWKKRQFKSDNVSLRVQKYRQKKRQSETLHETLHETLDVTPPDTDTDTDTDTDIENKDIYIVGQSSQTSMNTSQTEKKTKSPPIPYAKIINYLNEKTQSNYKVTSKTTRRLIRARWRDGFTLEDFYKVIDVKTEQWLGDSNMDQYLRPQTLFSGKFEAYLNEGKRSKTIKRSNTLCSETTVHNIEVANAWLEHKRKKEEGETNERPKEVP